MRFIAALAAAGALFGGMVLVLSASGRHDTSTTTLFSGTVGALYLIAGLIAHWRQPENRTGLLMVLVGIGWFAEDLQVSIDPLTHTIGLLLRSASTGLLLHLVLAFPTGELRSRIDRVMVTIGYVAVFGLVPLSTVAFPTIIENLLLIWPVYWVREVIDAIQAVVSAMVLVVLAVRWLTATRPARRVLAPVVLTGLLGATQSLLGPILNVQLLSDIGHAAILLLPLAFLAGVWRIRLGRTNVADLLVQLPRSSPGELQNLLAKALGDPSLRVAYYREDNGDYVDLEGQPLTISPSQSVSVVVRDGRQVAALLHDPALRDDRHVLEAVKSAAALELDNQRLAAEVRAQLLEVRASRARIVAAGDEQRRRVERDLHDGAQQQLVTVALLLKLAQQRLTDLSEKDAKLVSYLTRSSEGLQEALRELRELARGIHPAVLSEAGLGAALRALAARSPQPVAVSVGLLPSLPASVEATAYYVAAEAVTNALKHAKAKTIRITVSCTSSLSLEVADDGVGGASLSAGTGLLGLRDRAFASDGQLTVHSSSNGTTVRVVLPLETE
ncbi:histidine kinase [Kibdelosporangium philippinense]|uniref:histidine kinase n=1 Tax=Kibdelosporangium philippinense TaxID=211113 RepID=A0ABS8ZFP8_9PSEU|nr:histidine kinase [Kibdelosporangium philippinense]MCE7006651.1 histidine kinase [Kibdelosporangium philippinense]